MCKTRTSSSGFIVNEAEKGDTLEDVFLFVEKNIDSWAGKHELWDMSLLDFRGLTSKSTYSNMEKGAMLSKKRAGLKTALVVESALGYGMMRMLQTFTKNSLEFELNVFRNHTTAILWLVS